MANDPARVLIVDDDPAVAEFLATVASGRGYESHVVNQSARAEEAVERLDPAVIVLDLVMPNLDGIQVLKRLATRPCHASIILMSGANSRALNAASHLAEAHGLRIRAVLKKPIEIETFEKALGPAPTASATINEQELRAALDTGQITAAFQPKVSLKGAQPWTVQGFEALARWPHPKFGAIPPRDFIPLAEKNGLIAPLTLAIFDLALVQAQQLKKRGLAPDIAVNLSGHLLTTIDLPDLLFERAKSAGIDPGQIVIEVTESAAMTDSVSGMECMARLRLKGFRLSLDDYGAGTSSLVRLYRMPFSELKIDRSFVHDLEANEESRIIVRSVVSLAHDLGLHACAEGVENMEACEFLRSIGCDFAQGHLISEALLGELEQAAEPRRVEDKNVVGLLRRRAMDAYRTTR